MTAKGRRDFRNRKRQPSGSARDGSEVEARGRANYGRKFLLLAMALLFGGVLCELTLRVFFAGRFPRRDEEHSLLYQYHPMLGWFPATNTTRQFTGARTVAVTHNSHGFRSGEPV